MRWLCDECVDAAIVARLRETGHDVLFIVESARGADDDTIAEFATRENRLLLTEDKDFGELVFRWNRRIPGLILLRIEPEKRAIKLPRLEAAIGIFADNLFGRYTVVEEARFRSRPLLRGST
jgi:predicted nuclease of predicted toxin-antitoxin system